MTLSILARFHTQSDAQVAASALRSAGLSPMVFDEHYGGIDWVAQSALGGYRVMLPEGELPDGRAILAIAAQAGPDPEAQPPVAGSLPATALTLAVGMVTGFEGGWLVTGIRKRQWLDPFAWFAGMVLSVSLFLILGLIWALVWNLFINPP
jgi:hypothetical protein